MKFIMENWRKYLISEAKEDDWARRARRHVAMAGDPEDYAKHIVKKRESWDQHIRRESNEMARVMLRRKRDKEIKKMQQILHWKRQRNPQTQYRKELQDMRKLQKELPPGFNPQDWYDEIRDCSSNGSDIMCPGHREARMAVEKAEGQCEKDREGHRARRGNRWCQQLQVAKKALAKKKEECPSCAEHVRAVAWEEHKKRQEKRSTRPAVAAKSLKQTGPT